MFQSFSLVLLLTLAACGEKSPLRKQNINLKSKGKTSVIVLGAHVTPEFKQEARSLGISVEGDLVLSLSGDAEDIAALNVPTKGGLDFTQDAPVIVENQEFGEIESSALYQAKKEFGILEFWKENPEADGRGVVVGVLDDGISPNQPGLLVTSTGERKLLKKASSSSFNTYDLVETEEGLVAEIHEGRSFEGDSDLNLDGKTNKWKAMVTNDGQTVCLDLDVSGSFSREECMGPFSLKGEYFILPNKQGLVLMAQVDLANKKLQIFQTEKDNDSHGEGVASVMAGHRIGNLMGHDGMAPGAQILDYDLSEETARPEEKEYTLGTFLKGLEWLGMNGAEVVNISYSLFFTNVKSQTFMAKALNALVEKYNMLISFSAGNNGPGLGSLNRRLIYPSSVLVAGAFVPKGLDERVHGVTGLPEEGRVIYYSSRGPGAGGGGPLMIAPLSSLTNSSSNRGFQAFSGTSSASPALAGAGAVLISALKQKGLKVDAPTIVHAMRLSGRRLKAEPFVSQGYGLPQIGEALRIYESLMKGEKLST